ncbi:MAG TPA: hypothetical protein VGF17_12700 [Phytomonospora sp.]
MTTSNPFGDIEDKSLNTGDLETKDAGGDTAPALLGGDLIPALLHPSPTSDSASVEMLHHATDPESGANLLPGETYTVSAAYADTLVGTRRAVAV